MAQHHYVINFFYHSCYPLPNRIAISICWYFEECLAADTMRNCLTAFYCKDVHLDDLFN